MEADRVPMEDAGKSLSTEPVELEEAEGVSAPSPTRPGNPARLKRLLLEWMNEDDGGEQQETLDQLIKNMNETRKGQRILFPEHLRGKTW